ncbi:DNA-binding transcriptional regulator [Phenylobacterium aquaticum]|uniref:helix-turn-helix domain-containing protein n=1 Tax=Phenylobacterium aquaticum TaxID=1763816 RepID=UPI0026EA6F67|nr:helix-turn-helix domain-containing protein [Phenylobacterium aquaticum]
MKNANFDRIMAGLNEAVEIVEGRADPSTYRIHAPPTVDVRAIRRRRGLTQAAFAGRYGFALGRVRDWEQGRTTPEPAIRILLTVLDKEPEAVSRALAAASD